MMRAERIAKRWNLKTRAKAGRTLLNWENRLREGALNYAKSAYEAGYEAGRKTSLPCVEGASETVGSDQSQPNKTRNYPHLPTVDGDQGASVSDVRCKTVSPPPPTETAHSDGLEQVVDRSSSGGPLSQADSVSHL